MKSMVLAALIAVLFMLIVAPVTFSQTCVQLGSIMDCSGPSGSSATAIPFGPNGGVIIGDQDTTPYTILTPTMPSASFNPDTLASPPTFRAPAFAPIITPDYSSSHRDSSSFGTMPLILGE